MQVPGGTYSMCLHVCLYPVTTPPPPPKAFNCALVTDLVKNSGKKKKSSECVARKQSSSMWQRNERQISENAEHYSCVKNPATQAKNESRWKKMRTFPFTTSKLVMNPLLMPLSTILYFPQTETRAIVKVNRDVFIHQKHDKHRQARINITVLKFKVEVLKHIINISTSNSSNHLTAVAVNSCSSWALAQ